MPTSRRSRRRIFPLRAETLDKGHGRLERRTLRASTVLNDYVDFPHVAQVCRIEREVIELKSGKQRQETVFAITSLPPEQANPLKLLTLNRAHWGIENRSHYVRDVTFDEDRSRIRVGNGPAMMACLRNVAIALARLSGFTNIASALRAFAHQPRRALAALGL
jgi:predicted transposase YbfD/YdcC